MLSTKTIALIGASGFIGRRIAKTISSEGHQIVAIIRPTSDRSLSLPPGSKIVACHLNPKDMGLREALASADAVIYAAGAVRGNCMDDFRPANVFGVEAVVEILAKMQTPPPLLLFSSLAASEPQLSNYAQSKREGEQVLDSYPELPTTIFRPPAVYGPGDKEMRPLFDWMRRGLALQLGPSEQRLSLLHVDDLTKAVIAWITSGTTARGSFELHDGREGGYRFKEIANAAAPGTSMRVIPLPGQVLSLLARTNSHLARLTGTLPMLSPGKVREIRHPIWVCDNSAISQAIGWSPEIPLSEGIEKLYL